MSNWMTWFPYDYKEESMMARLRKLTQLCVARDASVQTKVTQLLQSLLKHLTAVEKHEQYVEKIRKIQVGRFWYSVSELTFLSPNVSRWRASQTVVQWMLLRCVRHQL